jgi:hypothetical protein
MGKMGTPEHTSIRASCMHHRGLMYLEVYDHPPFPSLYHFLSLTKSKSLPSKEKTVAHVNGILNNQAYKRKSLLDH